MQKVGRNDPCPCGSGKKYKKCCEEKNKSKKFDAKLISGGQEKIEMTEKAQKISTNFFARTVQAPPSPPPHSPDTKENPL